MRFFAHLRPGSVLDRAWRGHHRLSGHVEGIEFKVRGAGPNASAGQPIYFSGELAADQIAQAQANTSIELAVVAKLDSSPVETDPDPSIEPDAGSVEVSSLNSGAAAVDAASAGLAAPFSSPARSTPKRWRR